MGLLCFGVMFLIGLMFLIAVAAEVVKALKKGGM